jgi:hypothetical protein
MIKAVASTLTALMLTVFMIKDRTWNDAGAVLMSIILWGLAIYLWARHVREAQRR